MVITAIQAILIAFAVGVIVGGVIGWKLTFNMRLAKIQEQQVIINKLKNDNYRMRSEIRNHKIEKTKEKVETAASVAAKGAIGAAKGAGVAVSGVADSLKDLLWKKKKEKKNNVNIKGKLGTGSNPE